MLNLNFENKRGLRKYYQSELLLFLYYLYCCCFLHATGISRESGLIFPFKIVVKSLNLGMTF